MPDYLKEVATKYPDQLYLIFDDNTYAGENSNVVNITYKQNDMGYLIGTFAACMTTLPTSTRMPLSALSAALIPRSSTIS